MRKLRILIFNAVRRVFGKGSTPERILKESWRKVLNRKRHGQDTAIERKLRLWMSAARATSDKTFSGRDYTVMWSDSIRDEHRIGVYAKGGCDLPALFSVAPQFRASLKGLCGMFVEPGGISSSRSDILLQTLEQHPDESTREIVEKLSLPRRYFEPALFEPTFTIPAYSELGPFPKSAVILSMGPDVVRTVYRHRESGLLVDPGGWWLNQDMESVLANLDKVNWFRKNFEDIGRIEIDDFYSNYVKIIKALKERTTENILVLNMLDVEPGDPTHTYQLVWNPASKRRREFNLALMDLSRELGFAIVDSDKILKENGVESQVDFAHYTNAAFGPLGTEIHRILTARGLMNNRDQSFGHREPSPTSAAV